MADPNGKTTFERVAPAGAEDAAYARTRELERAELPPSKFSIRWQGLHFACLLSEENGWRSP